MMHASHLMSGTAAAAWLAVAVDVAPPVGLAGVAVGGLAALTPDLDHPSARGVRFLGPIGWVLCRVLRFASRLTTGIEHRGLTHTLAFALAVGALVALVASLLYEPDVATYFGGAATCGVVAALLGDLVTRASLKHLFWPLDVRLTVPRWARIKTGGLVEALVVLPLVSAATALGVAVMCGVTLGFGAAT